MIESMLSSFSDSSSNSRHQSTLTLFHFRLVCLLTLSHVPDEYAIDWWSDLTGGGGYYGSSGYDSSGASGSRPAGVTCSDDEDAGRDDDDDAE